MINSSASETSSTTSTPVVGSQKNTAGNTTLSDKLGATINTLTQVSPVALILFGGF